MHGCVALSFWCMMGELKGGILFCLLYLANMLYTIIPWPRNTWLSVVFLCPINYGYA